MNKCHAIWLITGLVHLPGTLSAQEAFLSGTRAVNLLATMDAVAAHCPMTQPQLEELNEIRAQGWPIFLAEAARRARLLHPDLSEGEISRQIDSLVAETRADTEQTYKSGTDCGNVTPEYMLSFLRGDEGPAFLDLLAIYASGPSPEFGQLLPFQPVPGFQTHVLPGHQQSLYKLMTDHLAVAGCQSPRLTEIGQAGQFRAITVTPDIIVSPAVQFDEEWRFSCADGSRAMLLNYVADSDGPVGRPVLSVLEE
ncbi:MAG: hypothetical protein Q4G26_06670 [Paracoccus sp. (in: a-proteobacteria)]|nr:hypothetical protein [Paracoccus sp. (in: a-proteobacteria)]